MYVWVGGKMDEYRMVSCVLMAEVNGRWVGDRPRLGWMDGVNMALDNIGMTWRLRDNIRKMGKSAYVTNSVSCCQFCSALHVFFRTALPCFCVYHLERDGMPLHDWVGSNCKKGPKTEN